MECGVVVWSVCYSMECSMECGVVVWSVVL